MSRRPDRLTDIACEIKDRRPLALLIYDGVRTEWAPKSQCEENDDGTVTMPEWLAREKGFI